MNGLFHFLSIQRYGCKHPGDPLIMHDFFQGFLSQGRFFWGVNLHSYLFSGYETDIFFQISSFSEGSNQQKFNSRGFMSQTIILSMMYWFLKKAVANAPVPVNILIYTVTLIFTLIRLMYLIILFLYRELKKLIVSENFFQI